MDDAITCPSVLQSFFLNEAQVSMEQNICHTQAYQESLLREKDQANLAQVLNQENAQLEETLEEEQCTRLNSPCYSNLISNSGST